MLTSLHVEGRTPFHRMSTRLKLGMLLAASILAFLTDSLLLLGIGFAVSAAFYFTLGLSFREAMRRLSPVLFTIAILAVINSFSSRWRRFWSWSCGSSRWCFWPAR